MGLRNVEKQSLMAFVESQAGHVERKCWSIFGRHLDLRSLRTTPQKISMEPENHLFEKENHLQNHPFLGSMLIFRGVSLRTIRASAFFFLCFHPIPVVKVLVTFGGQTSREPSK